MNTFNFTFDMRETGRKISTLRKQLNMTQVELADKLNISYQAVSNWERGESMPDISKLPELARIFNVSVDDILGNCGQSKVIEKILDGKTSEIMQNEEISNSDIIKSVPLLKPNQINELFHECEKNFTIGEISAIAPFLDTDTIDKLAIKACDTGSIGKLPAIAPFVSKETLDKLAMKVCDIGSIGELCSIAPFISRDTMDNLAEKICETDDIGELCCIAPFISKKVITKLALKSVKENGFGSITSIMPFIDMDIFKEFII